MSKSEHKINVHKIYGGNPQSQRGIPIIEHIYQGDCYMEKLSISTWVQEERPANISGKELIIGENWLNLVFLHWRENLGLAWALRKHQQ